MEVHVAVDAVDSYQEDYHSVESCDNQPSEYSTKDRVVTATHIQSISSDYEGGNGIGNASFSRKDALLRSNAMKFSYLNDALVVFLNNCTAPDSSTVEGEVPVLPTFSNERRFWELFSLAAVMGLIIGCV